MTGDMYNPRLSVATNEDLITTLRERVESGTIKGAEEWTETGYLGTGRKGRFLVIPVSDGGSET